MRKADMEIGKLYIVDGGRWGTDRVVRALEFNPEAPNRWGTPVRSTSKVRVARTSVDMYRDETIVLPSEVKDGSETFVYLRQIRCIYDDEYVNRSDASTKQANERQALKMQARELIPALREHYEPGVTMGRLDAERFPEFMVAPDGRIILVTKYYLTIEEAQEMLNSSPPG